MLFLFRAYIDALCEEINDTLQEVGQMMVADLSKNFALPNSFLMQVCTSSCMCGFNKGTYWVAHCVCKELSLTMRSFVFYPVLQDGVNLLLPLSYNNVFGDGGSPFGLM